MSKELLINSFLTAMLFILICCAIGKIMDIIRTAIFSVAPSWLVGATFLGTAHHELSHALLALLTGAKINSITLVSFSGKGGKLGEVKFTPRGFKIFQAIQTVLASAAPMLLGSLSLYLLITLANPMASGLFLVFLIYLEISIFLHMSLSSQDVKNIFSQFFWLLIILTAVFYFFGFALKIV